MGGQDMISHSPTDMVVTFAITTNPYAVLKWQIAHSQWISNPKERCRTAFLGIQLFRSCIHRFLLSAT